MYIRFERGNNHRLNHIFYDNQQQQQEPRYHHHDVEEDDDVRTTKKKMTKMMTFPFIMNVTCYCLHFIHQLKQMASSSTMSCINVKLENMGYAVLLSFIFLFIYCIIADVNVFITCYSSNVLVLALKIKLFSTSFLLFYMYHTFT
jgi:hypothetical protein